MPSSSQELGVIWTRRGRSWAPARFLRTMLISMRRTRPLCRGSRRLPNRRVNENLFGSINTRFQVLIEFLTYTFASRGGRIILFQDPERQQAWTDGMTDPLPKKVTSLPRYLGRSFPSWLQPSHSNFAPITLVFGTTALFIIEYINPS